MTVARFDTVLFDLDGTLANTIDVIIASYQYAVKTELGQDLDAETARSWIGLPLSGPFSELAPDRWQDLEVTYRAYNESHIAEMTTRYDGIEQLLRNLNATETKLGVVTSKRRATAEMSLDHVGITGLIEIACGVEDTERHKPEPEPIIAGVERVHGDITRAAYVGDAVFDIRAAKAANVTAIAVTWGAEKRDVLAAENPDHICDTVADLERVLLR